MTDIAHRESETVLPSCADASGLSGGQRPIERARSFGVPQNDVFRQRRDPTIDVATLGRPRRKREGMRRNESLSSSIPAAPAANTGPLRIPLRSPRFPFRLGIEVPRLPIGPSWTVAKRPDSGTILDPSRLRAFRILRDWEQCSRRGVHPPFPRALRCAFRRNEIETPVSKELHG